MLTKNINLEEIKRVKEQITEEFPGDDVSPGIRFKGSALITSAKHADGREARPFAREKHVIPDNAIQEVPELVHLSYDDSTAKGSAGTGNYRPRDPNLILQPGHPVADYQQLYGQAVVHDYAFKSSGKNPEQRPSMMAQL